MAGPGRGRLAPGRGWTERQRDARTSAGCPVTSNYFAGRLPSSGCLLFSSYPRARMQSRKRFSV